MGIRISDDYYDGYEAGYAVGRLEGYSEGYSAGYNKAIYRYTHGKFLQEREEESDNGDVQNKTSE